jgi:transcriptional regulator with AAA-type ATPase domain
MPENKAERIETADGHSLFPKGINSMPPGLQSKLARFLR